MRCPKCSSKTYKARLDVYWCHACNKGWLIHSLKYPTFEAAAETNHEARLKKDFLDPLTEAPKG